ncbi:MAG: hypothetical protein IPH85_09770 [Ignavibacteria bacterium]|nr:hypothetical protein [Ignavibacteria bacterium]MBP6510582.1 hypothetical protein [Candidatus Kapabacteria bacterium]MBK7033585.1 hypothetical protein [Ignavibacteria bacterium]MBK7186196.1 hypothetical protein [Ignavibacteria bacterium]MBK7578266.1 hypothetical protein [Ignavibacteria bacterium]
MFGAARLLPFLMILAALAATSCTTPRPDKVAPCVTDRQVDLVIRWGTEHDSLGTVEQFTMNTKGELFTYRGSIAERADGGYSLAVEQSKYCDLAKDVMSCFLKTQALNVRGTRARYIEYRNVRSDVYLRAVWNPDLETFQSRDMRELYDQLMKLIPRD